MTSVDYKCTINTMQALTVDSIHSTQRVQGFTHNFYRYPARFSPEFAREVIEKFSRRDDCILDIFMGGGTSIVEAIAAGRKVIGVDINSLALFITEVKTTPLSLEDQRTILEWVDRFNIAEVPPKCDQPNDPRLKNLPDTLTNLIITAIENLVYLRLPRQRRFVKCALLKVGQCAVDFRETPTRAEIMTRLAKEIRQMLLDMDSLATAARKAGIYKNKITKARVLIEGSITDQTTIRTIAEYGQPRLILTSPPYPGVHVLYHRWQIAGRRETSIPYWIAGLQDGRTASYYTMGGRSKSGMTNYFENIRLAFDSLRSVISPAALIIQLVGFSHQETQLPAFLNAMNNAGYQELFPDDSISARQSRNVPNRKWYTTGSKLQDASQEILLFHTPRR